MSILVSNNSVKMSARKVRLVADTVRNIHAKDAIRRLRFCEKKGVAIILTKLINSGLAIAQASEKYDLENLVIKKIFVDEGPTMKRIQPRAQGRAYRVRHRTSYIKVEMAEK